MESNKGDILSWGCGEFGQHGHGNTSSIMVEDSLMPSLSERAELGEMQSTEESSSLLMWRLKVFDCGASHTVVVTGKDEVYAWGNGNSGQLGCGDKKTHLTPQRIRLPSESKSSPIRGVACGSRHAVLWLENGLCFSWGNNFYAQLGYDFRVENYKDNQVLPHLLRPIAHMKVNQVACGEKHTLFLYNTGIVAACGCNNFGQLGTGSHTELVSPKPLESLEGIVFIACGANHSMAVTADGDLFIWGLGRACGNRREDVLFPSRKMTRRSNVASAAGGSSHSLALTANGTVYTWGGGTEGQLGHGSKVLYLRNPKPLSHDALPKASQIACSDSYTAAVTAAGILYMWGQNSHVIPTSNNTNSSHQNFVPQQVSPGRNQVASIACGSWHAMAVTGTPEWQPLEVDSEEEEGDDGIISSAVDTESEGRQAHTGVGSISPEVVPEQTVCHETIATDRCVQRESTKLTLAEFYAPTPIPTTTSPPEMDLDQDGKEEKEDFFPDSGTEPSITEGLESEPKEQKISDEIESAVIGNVIEAEPSTKIDLTSVEGEISSTPAVKNKSEEDELATEVPETGKEKVKRQSDRPQNRSRDSKMIRSKTMPVVTRKPLKMAPASTISGSDWSELSKPPSSAGPERDKFVIQKHVSVHSNRRGNGFGDKAIKRNLLTHVRLQSFGEGDQQLVQSATQNSLPQLPKLNRAKTYYGQMNQKRGNPEPRRTQFLYTLPPTASHTSSPFSSQRSHQQALLEKPPGPFEHSPNRTKTNLDQAPTVPELRSRRPRKPVFSSASSWKKRNKDDAVL